MSLQIHNVVRCAGIFDAPVCILCCTNSRPGITPQLQCKRGAGLPQPNRRWLMATAQGTCLHEPGTSYEESNKWQWHRDVLAIAGLVTKQAAFAQMEWYK